MSKKLDLTVTNRRRTRMGGLILITSLLSTIGLTQSTKLGDAISTTTSQPLGENIKGSDHPELFSRRIAFQSLLELLSIHSEDALHLQRRANLIEKDGIGLTDEDAAVLDRLWNVIEQKNIVAG